MTRLVPFLAFVAIHLVSVDAEADTGTLNLQLGATQIQTGGDAAWRPTLHTDFAFDLAGPLQAGAFVEVMASGLPLRHPGLGGGILVALRPEIPVLRLRPVLEASAGRLQMVIDSNDKDAAWVTRLTAGLGVSLGGGVVLEGRLTHAWLHQLPANSRLDDRSWLVSLGLGIDL